MKSPSAATRNTPRSTPTERASPRSTASNGALCRLAEKGGTIGIYQIRSTVSAVPALDFKAEGYLASLTTRYILQLRINLATRGTANERDG